ncbi:MAG: GvpL/GvpF family gas vesicle protein [Bacillota bacterium]
MACYLYALCYKDTAPAPFSSWPRGVSPGGELSYVCFGPIAGLVQEVNLSEFGTEALAQNIQRIEWLEEKVRAHDEVVRHLFSEVDAVVPVRFCTIFRTEERVKELLRKQAEMILADFNRLRAAAEWGVKVYVNEKQSLQAAEHACEVSQEAGSGIQYLRRKQQQEKLARQVKEWIRGEVNDCHQSLVKLSREYRVNPCEGSKLDERMALNSVYLVDRTRKGEWLAELERFSGRWSGRSLRLEVSGPWPPYSFVTPAMERDEPDE